MMNEVFHYLPGIVLSLSAMILALMSPGPNILAVIGTSMSVGRRSGAALAFGVASGTFLWAATAVLGLTALLNAYAGLLMFIKIAGGCYLIYLGYRSLRSAMSKKQLQVLESDTQKSGLAYFRRGLIVQMTNPKAALAMTAIVTLGIQGDAPYWVNVILVVGITSLSIAGHLLYAYAFSTQPVVRTYIRFRRWIEAAFGTFFCYAGLRILTARE